MIEVAIHNLLTAKMVPRENHRTRQHLQALHMLLPPHLTLMSLLQERRAASVDHIDKLQADAARRTSYDNAPSSRVRLGQGRRWGRILAVSSPKAQQTAERSRSFIAQTLKGNSK